MIDLDLCATPYGVKYHRARNESPVAPLQADGLRRWRHRGNGLWRVPTPVAASRHDLKYSLFYGRPGVREVGYDNERGKGDHRHFLGAETAYAFVSVKKLMADFWSDVKRLRGAK
ncbi:MAG TPA: DUF6516 family protein [Terracidiphilus sp.]|nr:DUF6516 family protein [Terracidiphilus sp.]